MAAQIIPNYILYAVVLPFLAAVLCFGEGGRLSIMLAFCFQSDCLRLRFPVTINGSAEEAMTVRPGWVSTGGMGSGVVLRVAMNCVHSLAWISRVWIQDIYLTYRVDFGRGIDGITIGDAETGEAETEGV